MNLLSFCNLSLLNWMNDVSRFCYTFCKCIYGWACPPLTSVTQCSLQFLFLHPKHQHVTGIRQLSWKHTLNIQCSMTSWPAAKIISNKEFCKLFMCLKCWHITQFILGTIFYCLLLCKDTLLFLSVSLSLSFSLCFSHLTQLIPTSYSRWLLS